MLSGLPPNKWKVVKFSDIGTTEPFVARITLGLFEALCATHYQNRDEISDAISSLSMDCLMPAFMALRALRQNCGNPDIPALTKIRDFDDLYKYLWTAYKDRMKSVARLMGYDIGFLFQKDPLFAKGCEEFPKAHSEVSRELIALMKVNRTTWQPELKRFRNDYLEHRTLQREDVAVSYSLKHAELIFHSVWVAIEEILIVLIAAGLPPHVRLREIPEAERIPAFPKRFGFSWAGSPLKP